MAPKTRTYLVKGLRSSKTVAARLLDAGAWFQVTPIAEDVYEFMVKDETVPRRELEGLCKCNCREVCG